MLGAPRVAQVGRQTYRCPVGTRGLENFDLGRLKFDWLVHLAQRLSVPTQSMGTR